jgi:hypothetical protein
LNFTNKYIVSGKEVFEREGVGAKERSKENNRACKKKVR